MKTCVCIQGNRGPNDPCPCDAVSATVIGYSVRRTQSAIAEALQSIPTEYIHALKIRVRATGRLSGAREHGARKASKFTSLRKPGLTMMYCGSHKCPSHIVLFSGDYTQRNRTLRC